MNDPIIGHNSGVDGSHLKAFIERIERVNSAIDDLKEDVKEIFIELKSSGFDPKIVRKVILLRKMDHDKRAEMEAVLDVYMKALGDYAELPLGKAAIDRVRG